MNKIVFIGIALIVFACNNAQENPKGLQDEIAKLEAEGTDKAALANLYLAHYQKYPNDTLNAKYVTKLANYYVEILKIDSAKYYATQVFTNFPNTNIAPAAMLIYALINEDLSEKVHWYKQIIEKYPNSLAAEDALIRMAFDYENALMKEEAVRVYGEYLAVYPNGKFAADAQASIKNIDKTPEQLVEEFERKNKENPNP
jgi:TolA-binding protein